MSDDNNIAGGSLGQGFSDCINEEDNDTCAEQLGT